MNRAVFLWRARGFLLALGCLLLSACASSPKLVRGQDWLARHPSNERRISPTPLPGYSPTGVWRVTGARNTVYLAGTSHLVTREQIPFPSSFYAAYHDAKEIYLEVKDDSRVGEVRMTFMLAQWLKKHRAELMLPKGQTLADHLAPEIVRELKALYGPSYSSRQAMTPLFLIFMAQAEGFGAQAIEEGGVEDVFSALARADRKPIRALDDGSINKVTLLALDEMLFTIKRDIADRGADIVVVESVLSEQEPITETDWRSGNLENVEMEMAEMRAQAPTLYERIGPERNRKWLSKIKKLLQGRKNALVLVGLAHFAGPDGLLALLENAGYKVEQMFGVEPMQRQIPPNRLAAGGAGENSTRR